jgi:hypothetical protein
MCDNFRAILRMLSWLMLKHWRIAAAGGGGFRSCVWVPLSKRCLLLARRCVRVLLPMSCLRDILARSCARVLLPRISRFLILRKLLDDGDRTHRTYVSPPLSVASAFPVYGGVFWLLVMAGMVSGQNSSLAMEHLLVLLFAQ